MLLEKSDLEQIEKIVEKSSESTKKELRQEIKATVEKSVDSIKKDLRQEIQETVGKSESRINKKIDGVKTELNQKIDGVENRIIFVIKREVGDLAEINRDVIQEVAKINDLEKRIIRIERKVGITS